MGFVTPATVSVAGVLAARAHVPPESASVTVTMPPAWVAVAEHAANAALRVMAGAPPMVNAALKVIVTAPAAPRAPSALVVMPTVQLVDAPGAVVTPENVTPVTLVAAIVTAAPVPVGTAAVVSRVVATLNEAAGYVPAGGLVTPAIVTVDGVFAPSAHVPPEFASVIVTTLAAAAPVAEHDENAALRVIVGTPGTVNDGCSVTVIVLPAANAPAALEVKPAVHAVTAPGDLDTAVNEMLVGVVAAMTALPGATSVVSVLVCTPNEEPG